MHFAFRVSRQIKSATLINKVVPSCQLQRGKCVTQRVAGNLSGHEKEMQPLKSLFKVYVISNKKSRVVIIG